MLKAFLFEVWDQIANKEVLVIATDETSAIDKLSCIISDGEDYELNEEFDYDEVLI
jgi:hypothetical protein